MEKATGDLDHLPRMSPVDEPVAPSGAGGRRRGLRITKQEAMIVSGLFRLFIGLILILAGLYAILIWWGFSTMIDPSLPDTEWWAEWKGKAFAGELLIALTL